MLWLAMVYPRVGGGTSCEHEPLGRLKGLSPRGRGNLVHTLAHADAQGSIPAWAGEPAEEDETPADVPVYPRVGGGTR